VIDPAIDHGDLFGVGVAADHEHRAHVQHAVELLVERALLLTWRHRVLHDIGNGPHRVGVVAHRVARDGYLVHHGDVVTGGREVVAMDVGALLEIVVERVRGDDPIRIVDQEPAEIALLHVGHAPDSQLSDLVGHHADLGDLDVPILGVAIHRVCDHRVDRGEDVVEEILVHRLLAFSFAASSISANSASVYSPRSPSPVRPLAFVGSASKCLGTMPDAPSS